MNRLWKQRQGAKARLAARHTNSIREGLLNSVEIHKIVDDWLNTHHTKEVTSQQARDWARVNVHLKDSDLRKALTFLYAEGYLLGEDIAKQSLAKVALNKAAPSLNDLRNALAIDWKKWSPGNRAAAALLNPPNGLKKLLRERDITVRGLGDTTISRIGTILAQGLKEGATPSSLAPAIEDLLSPLRNRIASQLNADVEKMMSDSERALMIAQTEMSRAVSVANREMYQDSGVELVEWLVADPCDECQENADVSPIGIDETFPSGDTEPPAHPNCVCDLAPYMVDTKNIGEDALSLLLDDQEN